MNLPATRKLYWADPCRRRFTARVLERRGGERPSLILNRSLFYPDGGGQPHDRGRLGEAQVLDVTLHEGVIQHYVNRLPAGDEVSGEIDWPRRWDHMQQHSGQHLLSAAFLSLLDRPTIGFHLSSDSLTIDLPGQPPEAGELEQVSDFCQELIAENRPIHARIYDPEQAATLSLRKSPAVEGPVRVVEIEGIDRSACGGTHVPATAAIGALAVTRLERRGRDTRVHFLCGGRAAADHRRRLQITQALAERLTTGLDDLPDAVTRLQSQRDEAQKTLRRAESQVAALEAARLLAGAEQRAGLRLVRHTLEEDDPAAMRRLLSALLEHERCLALLGWTGGRPRWAAGRSAGVDLDLRTALPALRQLGARGGGSADLIQGGADDAAALNAVLDCLESVFSL